MIPAGATPLTTFLTEVANRPEEVMRLMRRHGYVIDRWPTIERIEDVSDPVTRWQAFAFTLYTIIVEDAGKADRILNP